MRSTDTQRLSRGLDEQKKGKPLSLSVSVLQEELFKLTAEIEEVVLLLNIYRPSKEILKCKASEQEVIVKTMTSL